MPHGPNRRTPRNEGRSSKLVCRIVTNAAARARVRSHVHPLHAAFSVRFLEEHPGDLDALLQYLLGHAWAHTTRVYLHRQDQFGAMKRVRDLSWGRPGLPTSRNAPSGIRTRATALKGP